MTMTPKWSRESGTEIHASHLWELTGGEFRWVILLGNQFNTALLFPQVEKKKKNAEKLD